jgi:hypothetical protein
VGKRAKLYMLRATLSDSQCSRWKSIKLTLSSQGYGYPKMGGYSQYGPDVMGIFDAVQVEGSGPFGRLGQLGKELPFVQKRPFLG